MYEPLANLSLLPSLIRTLRSESHDFESILLTRGNRISCLGCSEPCLTKQTSKMAGIIGSVKRRSFRCPPPPLAGETKL